MPTPWLCVFWRVDSLCVPPGLPGSCASCPMAGSPAEARSGARQVRQWDLKGPRGRGPLPVREAVFPGSAGLWLLLLWPCPLCVKFKKNSS